MLILLTRLTNNKDFTKYKRKINKIKKQLYVPNMIDYMIGKVVI